MPPRVRIAAGQLRHQIQISQPTNREDDNGNVRVGDQSPIATVWARIEALNGRELYAAQQKVAQVTHRILIRYVPGLNSGMNVWFGDPGSGLVRQFQIEAIENPDEIPHALFLLCLERDDATRELTGAESDVPVSGGSGGSPVVSQPVVFTPDGATSVFTLPSIPPRGIMLFWNGLFQLSGAGNDYTLDQATITMTLTPKNGDSLVAFYL